MRIVSLLPSATEIVCALGLQEYLVGVSHECDYPPSVRNLPKVTRTMIPPGLSSREIDQKVREELQTGQALYTLDFPLLKALQPDLIVTQALCDVCAVGEAEVQEAICKLPGNPKVIHLEPTTLAQVLDSIRQVAEAAGVEERAEDLIEKLAERIQTVAARTATLEHRPRAALLEWLDPPFACGHWNPELVRLAGGVEGLGKEGQPARTIQWEELLAWEPEVVFIACCGFSVERTMEDLAVLHSLPGWQDLPAVQSGRVYVTDGSHYFSRPGPRLVDSLEMLAHALHPETHPLPAGIPSPLRVDLATIGMWAHPQKTKTFTQVRNPL